METGGTPTARLREFPGSGSEYGWREHPGPGRVPAPARHPVTILTRLGRTDRPTLRPIPGAAIMPSQPCISAGTRVLAPSLRNAL